MQLQVLPTTIVRYPNISVSTISSLSFSLSKFHEKDIIMVVLYDLNVTYDCFI